MSFGTKRFRLSGHALFGKLRQSYSAQAGSNTTFATAFGGGGADCFILGLLDVRRIQADHLRTSTNVGIYTADPGNHGSNRISTCIVFCF